MELMPADEFGKRRYTWMAGSGPGHDALAVRQVKLVMPRLVRGIHEFPPPPFTEPIQAILWASL